MACTRRSRRACSYGACKSGIPTPEREGWEANDVRDEVTREALFNHAEMRMHWCAMAACLFLA